MPLDAKTILNILAQLGGQQSFPIFTAGINSSAQLPVAVSRRLPSLPPATAIAAPPILNPNVLTPPTFPGAPSAAEQILATPLPPSIAQMGTPTADEILRQRLETLKSLGIDLTQPPQEKKITGLKSLLAELAKAAPQAVAVGLSRDPARALSDQIRDLQAQQQLREAQGQQRKATLANLTLGAESEATRRRERKSEAQADFEKEQRRRADTAEQFERQQKIAQLENEARRIENERKELARRQEEAEKETRRAAESLKKATNDHYNDLLRLNVPSIQAKEIAVTLAKGEALTPAQERVYQKYVSGPEQGRQNLRDAYMRAQMSRMGESSGMRGMTEGQLFNEIQQPHYKTPEGEIYIPSKQELEQGVRNSGQPLGNPMTFQEKLEIIQGQRQQLRGQAQATTPQAQPTPSVPKGLATARQLLNDGQTYAQVIKQIEASKAMPAEEKKQVIETLRREEQESKKQPFSYIRR